MEFAVTEDENVPVEITELKDTDSTEKFQKFIHELFEKNGVLNDLRAYLRGHILGVLKSVDTGDPMPCQKNFTQRLELTFQAMNILFTEYLLRLDFNYSLSIFTSEIPLSNMVFKFARSLLKANDTVVKELRFGESDIWKILSYLGIKCDSEHASKIVETYRSQTDSPLLWCILKCIPLYHEPTFLEQVQTSEESLSCDRSEGSQEDRMNLEYERINKCKHYTVCKACQDRVVRLKEKYRMKKIQLEENPKASEAYALNVETFMKNVGILERSLIDEMFEQLKSVYETEVDMIREENEEKIRRSIANHALQLQNYREELEKSFAERHRQLSESVRQRQRFLCELAQRLAAVQAQEKTQKIQMQDAEETLKNKCELMRRQISEELKVLQSNLATVKQERDDIDKQKSELENLKQIYNTNNILKEETLQENEDLKRHYDLLKDEIAILRKCIESKASKCFVERGTEMDSQANLNNGSVGSLKNDGERLKASQVVNDFKKLKNVNLSQKYSECLEDRQSGSVDIEIRSDTENITVQHLREENERLKTFAKQQSEHIDRLTVERQRFQEEGARPRTAPSNACNSYYTQSVVNYPGELGVQARVLFPTDAIPFIGVVGGRNNDDHRRRLLSQWRRQRGSEESCETRSYMDNKPNTSTNVRNDRQTDRPSLLTVRETAARATCKSESPVKSEFGDKSPNTVARKAKQKLGSNPKEPTPPRERSPNATLKEAKLRLRKLEIEAEAVQRSYLDYRKRQMDMKGQRDSFSLVEDSIVNIEDVKKLDKKQSKSTHNLEKVCNKNEKFVYKESPETIKKDFDKYFREYQNIDIGKTHYCNLKNMIEKIKPIPESYSKLQEDDCKYNNVNYLEIPLLEFRKYYQTGHKIKNHEQNTAKIKNSEENNLKQNNLSSDDDRTEELSRKLVEKVIMETNIHLKVKENNNNTKQDSSINEQPNTKLNNIFIESTRYNEKIHTNNESDIKNESHIDIKLQQNEEDKVDNTQHLSPCEIENDITKFNLTEDSISESNIIELNDLENKIDVNKVDIFKDNENSLSVEIIDEKSIIVIEEKNVDEIYTDSIEKKPKTNTEIVNEENFNNNNLLIVEVENICTTTNIGVTESNQDVLVLVESSIDNNVLVLSEPESTKDIIPTQMTIIVSPKEDSILKDIDKTDLSPEITKLSENDVLNAIYRSDNKKISSIDLPLDENKFELDLNSEKGTQEYQDDFSADVDNYNSQSEYGNNSPISLPQMSENDNFWES